jgi:hypothetical protein
MRRINDQPAITGNGTLGFRWRHSDRWSSVWHEDRPHFSARLCRILFATHVGPARRPQECQDSFGRLHAGVASE